RRFQALVISVASVLLLAATLASARAETSLQTLSPGVLRGGTYFINPPFEFVSNGKRVGLEVDLINEIARRLRLRPLFVNTRWEVMLQQMQDGRYDCIVGGITITPARSQ